MIDCASTWNLTSQLLVQENEIPGNDEVPPGLKTLDGSPLRVYKNHEIDVQVEDSNHEVSTEKQSILGIDMKGSIRMILGLPWLRTASPMIYWKTCPVAGLSLAVHPSHLGQPIHHTSPLAQIGCDATSDAVPANNTPRADGVWHAKSSRSHQWQLR